MRNVNGNEIVVSDTGIRSFILTMRNVNIFKIIGEGEIKLVLY